MALFVTFVAIDKSPPFLAPNFANASCTWLAGECGRHLSSCGRSGRSDKLELALNSSSCTWYLVSSTWYLLPRIWHWILHTWYLVLVAQNLALGSLHLEPGIRFVLVTESGTGYLVSCTCYFRPEIWHLVFGIWYLLLVNRDPAVGFLHLALGVSYLVCGTWNPESGTGYFAPGTLNMPTWHQPELAAVALHLIPIIWHLVFGMYLESANLAPAWVGDGCFGTTWHSQWQLPAPAWLPPIGAALRAFCSIGCSALLRCAALRAFCFRSAAVHYVVVSINYAPRWPPLSLCNSALCDHSCCMLPWIFASFY